MHPTIPIDLIVDRSSTRDVLQAVLHAILFHRLFGSVKPQTLEVLDVTVPGVKDDNIEQLIKDKVDVFWRELERGTHKRGQISVTLSDKRQRKGVTAWLGRPEEEVPWEEWIVSADIRQPKTERERTTLPPTLSTSLTSALLTILTHTASVPGRAAVPKIRDSSGISPFPVRIGVKVAGVEVG